MFCVQRFPYHYPRSVSRPVNKTKHPAYKISPTHPQISLRGRQFRYVWMGRGDFSNRRSSSDLELGP